MDWTLVVVVLVFLEVFLVLRGLMELSKQIEDGLQDLDTSLGVAITEVVQGLQGGIGEPINPIQAAIAQMLTGSLQQAQKDPSSVIEVLKGEDGKFLKKD